MVNVLLNLWMPHIKPDWFRTLWETRGTLNSSSIAFLFFNSVDVKLWTGTCWLCCLDPKTLFINFIYIKCKCILSASRLKWAEKQQNKQYPDWMAPSQDPVLLQCTDTIQVFLNFQTFLCRWLEIYLQGMTWYDFLVSFCEPESHTNPKRVSLHGRSLLALSCTYDSDPENAKTLTDPEHDAAAGLVVSWWFKWVLGWWGTFRYLHPPVQVYLPEQPSVCAAFTDAGKQLHAVK